MKNIIGIFVALFFATASHAQLVLPGAGGSGGGGGITALTGDCIASGSGSVATNCGAPHPGYITSNWYFPIGGVTGYATSSAAAANTITCFYGYFPQVVTIRNVGVGIVGAGTTNLQVALYKNSSGRPGALIDNTPNMLDTGAAANVTGALAGNQQFGQGTTNGRDIWFCSNQGDSTVTYRSVNTIFVAGGQSQGSATLANLLGSGPATVTGIKCTGASCNGGSSTFGSWPASLAGTTWADATASNAVPLVAFEVVSSP